MNNRHKDPRERRFLRTNIYVKDTRGFYFTTREGYQFGPYGNLQRVIAARELFVFLVTGKNSKVTMSLINCNQQLLMIERITAKQVCAQHALN